ncbi:RagB/SusD family nutrient uptake outer membrane protein [Mucilaginibacter sp. UR6-11]|uniref:RagB/SusD family nutrient uptake outer membrane protein n=1 Tax=Mucilaginibacter sp. UR6-11 TaxID=1435644 RepID=UPI001E33F044|nr:RagB/SusD family nutrient uptake outer membrane protein [Mucilaginibacter sp. UR6-11]MCC8426387.1 RagB/SusD family nutrient uptake outer membrane protein [Mucilaginibacter sp. UR6-11]
MKKDIKNIYRFPKVNRGVLKLLMLFTVVLALSFLNSCKKLIAIEPSGSKLLTTSVFTDSVTTQSALAGMYNVFAPQSGAYRLTMSTLPGFSADELQYVGNSFDPFINNSILSTEGSISSIWGNNYSAIYNANAIIEGMAASKNISVKFQNQAVAEARFIRAFCYFYLINLYGDVPLVLTTDINKNSTLGRTPTAEIYTQIIADLKFAQSTLPADYSISGGTRTRINKWIATAMLARVYLYNSDWVNAEAQATAVIGNTTLFSLQTDLTKVFTPGNTEAIWQLYNDNNGYTAYANTVLPGAVSRIPTYVLTPSLISAFEAGDTRKANWTNTLLYNGITYTYPYKYKSIVSGGNAEYYTMLRLAEQYLIRAEARAQQNNITGAQADITTIRQRAGLTATTAATTTTLLAAIAQERRIEFNCEWGHRWFDLKRAGTVNAVIGALKPTFWKPTATLYPIPASQITLNSSLTQNPGYN